MTRIEALCDVLPAIDGRPDFVVAERDWGTVVDYLYVGPDTFADPIRLECRGLKFARDGKLLARPLHKFFNLGEPQAPAVDLSRPHVVTEKLDGSMVHPAIVDGRLRLMTRMGLTDVSAKAEAYLATRPDLATWCECFIECDQTPVFEFVAPNNRIVLPYSEPRLVLLAVRFNRTGGYLSTAPDIAALDHPRVLATDAYGDWSGLAKHCEGLEGHEGYVIWFDDGQAVKVKAPWYVTRHRALDGLRHEHRVVELVLGGGVDDVVPMLDPADAAALWAFSARLQAKLADRAYEVRCTARALPQRGSRKEYALAALRHTEYDQWMRPLLFAAYDDADVLGTLRARTIANCSSEPRCSAWLEAIGAPRWAV